MAGFGECDLCSPGHYATGQGEALWDTWWSKWQQRTLYILCLDWHGAMEFSYHFLVLIVQGWLIAANVFLGTTLLGMVNALALLLGLYCFDTDLCFASFPPLIFTLELYQSINIRSRIGTSILKATRSSIWTLWIGPARRFTLFSFSRTAKF
jgi:hypothetical protein